ncbi:small integral membrane protein 15 [Etheostoma cragini]|uniref:small integral membrane protein 15 n=1 Tax=Etheostoma cragini TaxID=417921 RepID=UPI00155E8AC3|nr:small integral membrane protein 15 [Etheostoma cragini]
MENTRTPEQGGAGSQYRGYKHNLCTLVFFSLIFGDGMIDVRAWAEYVVEWAAKDPYGFLTTVILALTPLFIASALLSWKLAKMIEARDREQKKKQKRQENIAKAKRTKKD